MVRNYKRKTTDKYSRETLLAAVNAVREGQMTALKASTVYGVPRPTIISYLNGDRGMKSKTHGRPTVFTTECEKDMASMLHSMERHGFGLTQREVRALVGQYVRRNNIDTPFKDGIPGEEWIRGFKKRNKLSLKKPQSVEIARKKAADPFLVNEFYDLLEEIVQEQKLEGDQIWNLDETSFCQDPGKSKIIGLKGFQATRTTSSPGRDNTTVLFACNSWGQKIIPLIIFKGTYLWNSWLPDDDSIDSAFASTSKGWMEASVFESFFSNVLIPEICKTGKPQLVIYDGHSTHLDLNVILKAKENKITILKLPPHSSHILQPLDVSTMKAMKDRWDQKLIKWQRLNIGKKLPKKEFTQILVETWNDLEPLILMNGFRKTGIYPLDRNQIGEDKFDPASLQRWKNHLANKTTEEEEIITETQHIQKQNIETDETTQIIHQLEQEFEGETVQEAQKEQQQYDETTETRKMFGCVHRGPAKNVGKFKLIPRKQSNSNALTIISQNKVIMEQSEEKNNNINVTFGSLLLESISRGKEETKQKRKRLGIGAEVITTNDYIERKKKESEEKENLNKRARKVIKKKPKKTQPKKIQRKISLTTSESDIMSTHSDSDLMDACSDSDSENAQDQPLRKKSTHASILTVQADINYEPKTKAHAIVKKTVDAKDVNKTQVYKEKQRNLTKEEIMNAIQTDTEENTSNLILEVNDTVLVRYFEKKKWKFYVGTIQTIEKNDRYKVLYYKHSVDENTFLTFSVPKQLDVDVVPISEIVKKIELLEVKQNSNVFVLSNDLDDVYFK